VASAGRSCTPRRVSSTAPILSEPLQPWSPRRARLGRDGRGSAGT
jgi:hypothetical protein